MPEAIVSKELTKKFGNFTAVSAINFKVKEAENFGFLGPNGAGKTTTMKMIQCVSPKTSGKLEVMGLDVDVYPREIKMILGVVPQENNLDPDFSVYQNLIVYSRYFDIPMSEAKEKAGDLLEFVQLQDKRDVKIDKLSTGMKRRLILARALINDPKILVLDEPTIGLDPQARHLIWDKLRTLKSEGVTIVLTTHYMDEAAQLCDRIVIMDHGKILAEDSPNALIEKVVGTDIIEVKNDAQVIECLRNNVEKPSFEVAGDIIQVYAKNARGLVSTLLDECKLTQTTVRIATLEDVFLKLTGRALRE